MKQKQNRKIVLGVCGATGQIYARYLIELLLENQCCIDIIASQTSRRICKDELSLDNITDNLPSENLTVHQVDDLWASPASGSHHTDGMIICPCTLNTLGGLAAGISDNLIKRAGQVHLKQRRPLVIALREMPLSTIDLENMTKLSQARAVIAPLSPPFYHKPRTIEDLVYATAERLLTPLFPVSLKYPYKRQS